jgi:glycosyltransferase involved in cell wall biosynthesis
VSSLYAIASLLAGPGIGHTAHQAALGLWRAGRLARLVCLGHRPTEIADRVLADVRFLPRRALAPLSDKQFFWLKNRWFDRAARRFLQEDATVAHLWNSQATNTARQAKRQGKHLIIDRASTHIRTQTQILVEAYARHGLRYEPTYRETISRCVEEYDLADLVLTPSARSVRSFAEHGVDRAKVIHCPFGVDLSRYATRREPPPRFRALFVGQLGIRKGLLTLLHAWDRARGDGELWLVGGEEEVIGPQLAAWRDRADIKWLGFRTDVPELMAQASAFVFPSIEEGSALVTYEAMAAGLPLIVTDEAGSVARDGREALVVKPDDVNGLAAALTTLREQPERAWQMGKAARERVEAFPWTPYGDRVALVHGMLEAGRGGAEIQQALWTRWPETAMPPAGETP